MQQEDATESRVLWLESFDGVDTPAWFTHRAPEGWKTDVHGVDSGEARWKGWTFGDMRHWTWASGTDMRHYFTQAHDTFAIIDNKQQRLAEGDLRVIAGIDRREHRDQLGLTLASPLQLVGHRLTSPRACGL